MLLVFFSEGNISHFPAGSVGQGSFFFLLLAMVVLSNPHQQQIEYLDPSITKKHLVYKISISSGYNQVMHINLISILPPFLCSLTSLTSAVWTSVSMIACGISGLRTQNIATSGSIPSSFTGWVPLTRLSLPNRLFSHAARLLTISMKSGLSETTPVDMKQQSDQHLTDWQPTTAFFFLFDIFGWLDRTLLFFSPITVIVSSEWVSCPSTGLLLSHRSE